MADKSEMYREAVRAQLLWYSQQLLKYKEELRKAQSEATTNGISLSVNHDMGVIMSIFNNLVSKLEKLSKSI